MKKRFIILKVPESLLFLQPVECKNLIRVGGPADGGYVMPADLIPETDILLSLGIEQDWSFDSHFKKLNRSVRIYGYDHTLSFWGLLMLMMRKLFRLMTRPLNPQFDEFRKAFILLLGYIWFWKIRAKQYARRITNPIERPGDISLSQAIKHCLATRPGMLFIKMDIEGSEYTTIEDLIEYENLIKGMVIEFHDVNRKRDTFSSAIRLLKTRYDIVHLHGNNHDPLGFDNFPETLEITWLNKKTSTNSKKRECIYLDGIDAPNFDRPDYLFEFSSR